MTDMFGYATATPIPTVESIQLAEAKDSDTLAPTVIVWLRGAGGAQEPYALSVALADTLGHELRVWAARARRRHWSPPTPVHAPPLDIIEQILTGDVNDPDEWMPRARSLLTDSEDPLDLALRTTLWIALMLQHGLAAGGQDALTILDDFRAGIAET